MTVHWCGTGLSAVPGLRRLAERGAHVVVWNRTVENARAAVGDVVTDIRGFSPDALSAALSPGDIVVSMLPTDQHVPLAVTCLERGSNFVSSSYVSPQMRALDEAFRQKGLISLNEVGLDPGIDHLMAHDLVARYRASGEFDLENVLSFTSYCGGVPKVPNAFRYKFSWSPVGVLKALRSPSRSIRNFAELQTNHPWEAITSYTAPPPSPEVFEVYPNRDSLPFIKEYGFEPSWKIRDFVRGTIRLNGWAEAWAPVFSEIEHIEGSEGDARLAEMAAALWNDNAYASGEPDRVVLFASLKADRGGQTVFRQTWALDAFGDARGTAMARLVSVPVSLGVEAVMAGEIPKGVHAVPSDPAFVHRWLTEIKDLSQYMELIDQMDHPQIPQSRV